MNKDNEIQLDELLDVLGDNWPETEDQIDAALHQPAQPYTRTEADAMIARVLSRCKENRTSPAEAEKVVGAEATLFDHLDSIPVAPKIEVHTASERRQADGRVTDLHDLVAQAYKAVRNQMPVDFVILDPSQNAWFLRECRNLGARVSDLDLNKALMNARKSGRLANLTPSLPSPVDMRRIDEFAHAAEMALRLVQERWFLETHENVALDRILCDPRLREQFDSFASAISGEGYTMLELRWAALAHRKAGRKVRVDRALDLSMFEQIGRLDQIRTARIPATPGIYICQTPEQDAYLGATENLRKRVGRHLDVGPSLVPVEFGCDIGRGCVLGIVEMDVSAAKRNGMVSRFKKNRKPRLNFLGLLKVA